jgi:hypothetical protein
MCANMGDRIMAKRQQSQPASNAYPSRKGTGPKKGRRAQTSVAPKKGTKPQSAPRLRPVAQSPKKVARPRSSSSKRGNSPVVRAEIAQRLREIRQEIFGDHGGPELARRLNLPARTWYNIEKGATVPAELLLAIIDQTGANPWWVLTGKGSKYRRNDEL